MLKLRENTTSINAYILLMLQILESYSLLVVNLHLKYARRYDFIQLENMSFFLTIGDVIDGGEVGLKKGGGVILSFSRKDRHNLGQQMAVVSTFSFHLGTFSL